MGKIASILLTVFFLSAVFFIGSYVFFGKKLTLITEEQLGVYRYIDDLYSPDPSKNRIALLVPGQRLPVIACRNLKDDQIHKIRLSDGKEGYIERGEYKVVQENLKWGGFFEKIICY